MSISPKQLITHKIRTYTCKIVGREKQDLQVFKGMEYRGIKKPRHTSMQSTRVKDGTIKGKLGDSARGRITSDIIPSATIHLLGNIP